MALAPRDDGRELTMPSPVRLGLIGYGGIAQGYHRPGILANADVVKVTAAADVVPDNLEAAHAHYGVPRDQLYSDYRDMLAKAEIDAVDIATPHFLHAEQSIEAANAGKAVVCEKPMAVSSEQGDAIVEAVKRNGVPYSMGQMFLFCPAVVRGAELMRAEGMGTTFIGRTQTIGRGIEVGPNKEMPPAHVPDWYRTVAGGGGRLNTTTNHELYVLEHLMGSPIRYVEARVGTLHEGVEVDDTAIMLSEHYNGATSITLSSGRFMGDPPPLKRPTTGRFAEAQAPGGGVRAHFSLSPGALLELRPEDMQWHEVELDQSGDPTGHTQFIGATYGALARGEPTPLTVELARHNMALLEAAREATVTRRAVEVP